MGKTITTRLSDDIVEMLNEVAREENVDTSAVVRKLLLGALKDWRREYALGRLGSHEISIGSACRMLDVDLYEMMDIARGSNVDWVGYDDEDLEKDLNILKNDK
ncbi:MAG: UPF0175 family protein [Nanoarchaeota archaeon]|nr:UPF0175 family protein [Nanoarchaeota archaeon]